jgi:hypothetical protein
VAAPVIHRDPRGDERAAGSDPRKLFVPREDDSGAGGAVRVVAIRHRGVAVGTDEVALGDDRRLQRRMRRVHAFIEHRHADLLLAPRQRPRRFDANLGVRPGRGFGGAADRNDAAQEVWRGGPDLPLQQEIDEAEHFLDRVDAQQHFAVEPFVHDGRAERFGGGEIRLAQPFGDDRLGCERQRAGG